ncbi:MAG: hypothetical protein AB7E34_10325 [Acidaminococcaceae bacterium]
MINDVRMNLKKMQKLSLRSKKNRAPRERNLVKLSKREQKQKTSKRILYFFQRFLGLIEEELLN